MEASNESLCVVLIPNLTKLEYSSYVDINQLSLYIIGAWNLGPTSRTIAMDLQGPLAIEDSVSKVPELFTHRLARNPN